MTTMNAPHDLEGRLKSLERTRRWQWILIVLLMVSVPCGILVTRKSSPPPAQSALNIATERKRPSNLEASRFTLVDEEGRTRAFLGFREGNNVPLLRFFDQKGTMQVQVGYGGEGQPIIALKNDKGGDGVVLSQDLLYFLNKDGVQRAILYGDCLTFNNSKGERRASLGSSPEGGGGWWVWNADGSPWNPAPVTMIVPPTPQITVVPPAPVVTVAPPAGGTRRVQKLLQCRNCNGSGKTKWLNQCPECGGNGLATYEVEEER